MKQGKLTNQQLEEHIFQKLRYKRSETITGPGIGNDCAVLNLDSDLLVVSTDPITGTEKGIGKLCVNICCNDVAAAGGEPIAMLLTMLIPLDAEMDMVDNIVDDVIQSCEKLNVDLIGGHTEISSAVNRFVLSGVCIGRKSDQAQLPLRAGCSLVMSKTAGLEGTAIIAAEKKKELKQVLTDQELDEALSYLDQTSVVKEGLIGREYAALMHDATEGGILGAAWEMANSANLGVKIDSIYIPVSQPTEKICRFYQIDPLRLISSGVMLFATEHAEKLIKELKQAGISAAVIGEFYDGISVIRDDEHKEKTLEPPQSDELYEIVG